MRRAIDPFYINKIAELMAYAQMAGSPSKIHSYFRDEPQYTKYPALRTIKKYMAVIREGKLALMGQRKDFVYPVHMGPAEDQVPWELARYALDCLCLYLKECRIRPSIGLTRTFAQIANVFQPSNTRMTYGHAENIAIMAEKFWVVDLIGASPSRERPPTSYEEFIISSWNGPCIGLAQWAKEMGEIPLDISQGDFRFLKFMPVTERRNQNRRERERHE